jgi:hypothetical protein
LVIPGTLTKLEVVAEEGHDDLVVPRGQSTKLSALATFEGDDGLNHVYDVSSDALWTLSNPEEFVAEGYSISLHVYGTFKGSAALRNFEQDITEESYVTYLGGGDSFYNDRNVYHAKGEPGSVETISVRAFDEYSYHEFSDEITLTVGNPTLDDLIITERLELGDNIPLAQSREFIATGHFGSDDGEDFNQLVTDDVSWATNEPLVLSQKENEENIFFAETTGRAVVTATDQNVKVSADYNTEAIKFSDNVENSGHTLFHPATKGEAEIAGVNVADDYSDPQVDTVKWALLTWSEANSYCTIKDSELATTEQLINLSRAYGEGEYANINHANGWPILKRYWTRHIANTHQHYAYNMVGNANYSEEENNVPLLAICVKSNE